MGQPELKWLHWRLTCMVETDGVADQVRELLVLEAAPYPIQLLLNPGVAYERVPAGRDETLGSIPDQAGRRALGRLPRRAEHQGRFAAAVLVDHFKQPGGDEKKISECRL